MPKTILIAEDETVLRSMLADFLLDYGYEIIEAENGAIAWDLWKTSKCDLLITDINMPHLNGLDLLKKIKGENPDFPVIVVTGVTVEMVKNDATNLGAYCFLPKPFKMKELMLKINEVLED
jgi:DNA-binding response OmpR family regulator